MKKVFVIKTLLTVYLFSMLAYSTPKSANNRSTQLDISKLKAAAEKGDAQSQLEYGKAISKNGTESRDKKKKEEAASWIQKAADQGLGEAWFWLGYAGLGKSEAAYYYEKAAEKGYLPAFDYVFDALLFRARTASDIVKAKKFADLARKLFPNQLNESLQKNILTVDRCYEAGIPTIPSSDQASPEEKKVFRQAKTVCWAFQTGVSTARDWNKYRKCLLSQDEVDNNLLAEIYANAWGVKRNVKLALALVCHASFVPAELEGMVNTLYSTKDQDHLETEFSFCDHATSSVSTGLCAERVEEIDAAKREAETANLTQKWTEAQKNSFRFFRKIAEEFFIEHARSEQDMSGSMRSQIAVSEEAKLRDELLKAISSFEAGQFPKESDFAHADQDLNKIYSQLMKKKMNALGTITKDSIKTTQRKWLKYRDAWVQFAVIKYPNTPSDIWKVWMTKQRVKQLNEVTGQ